jgi:hypothetical protein
VLPAAAAHRCGWEAVVMSRYWLRVRAEYVVPVLATSREDALGLDEGDLVDELTPESLYSCEIIGAVPDSERHAWPTSAAALDVAEVGIAARDDADLSAAMLEVGERIRAQFRGVSMSSDELRSLVSRAIAAMSQQVAESVLGADADDRWARLPRLAERIRMSADSSARAYCKWRTQS